MVRYQQSANGLMVFYTYAAAGYSALPMDINYTFAEWSERRSKELEIESDIFWSYSEITREINTRLYDDLLRLKKISY